MGHKAKHGDIIKVDRGIYYHYGIYSEKPSGVSVIHYTGEPGRDLHGTVQETSLEVFLDGAEDYSVQHLNRKDYPFTFGGNETVKRARSRLGEDNYDLMFNNCEHFAMWCKAGEGESSQADTALKVLGGIAAVVIGAVGLGALLGKLRD